MSYLQTVVFHRPKVGSTEAEWEDGAGYDPGSIDRPARLVAIDGATQAYDSIRWVGQLVESFLGADGAGGRPALTPAGMDAWFERMQQRWLEQSPTRFASIYEERKFHTDGSFATLLGAEVEGLDTGQPRLSAAGIGDVVLFHVRERRLVAEFPDMAAEDFGNDPEGVFTLPSQLERMRQHLSFFTTTLRVGDLLFLATDAVAAWMVRSASTDGSRLWATLGELSHPDQFDALAREHLGSGRMKNDDLTLMRVEVTAQPPQRLLVYDGAEAAAGHAATSRAGVRR